MSFAAVAAIFPEDWTHWEGKTRAPRGGKVKDSFDSERKIGGNFAGEKKSRRGVLRIDSELVYDQSDDDDAGVDFGDE